MNIEWKILLFYLIFSIYWCLCSSNAVGEEFKWFKVNVYLIRSEKYIDELMLLFKRFFIDDFNFFLVHKE